ncbi:MAG: thiamine phosphate synthase [Verrucomicrobiota bacterium]|jgi:thiamine-phosphate pyrophosphorylase|nr:thiamine phosphate synthase [Verrucomicrobiota bacterium]
MIQLSGLYLVLTDPATGYERCAEAAVACGVGWLQLRMKRAADAEVAAIGRRLRDITRGTATRFILNDDVDLARAIDADGVHLGQGDLPLDEARRRWPAPGKVFGLSTHSRAQAARAVAFAPDYIGVGPVFATPTKAIPDPVLGVEEMGAIIRAAPMPAVAIGGIDGTNLPDVLQHGAKAFAVVRAVNRAADPEAAIHALQTIAQRQPLLPAV